MHNGIDFENTDASIRDCIYRVQKEITASILAMKRLREDSQAELEELLARTTRSLNYTETRLHVLQRHIKKLESTLELPEEEQDSP